jgi:small-conductance mechanosensitive channel
MTHGEWMVALRIALFATLLTLGISAHAQEAPTTPVETPAAAPVTAIATKTKATDNAEIAGRIRSIFSEIAALKAVRVQVSAGVVTLSGTVPTAEDVSRAEAIAGRVSGVVTVQNDVTRDLDVSTNLTPALGEFGQEIRGLIQALPLLGVALAIGLAIGFLGYLLASFESLWRWVMPNSFLAELVATLIRVVFIILGLIAVLEVLGATALLGGVLGGAGVIGIAIGFAVRDNVANYVSSIMLSLRQPFRANDHVVIEGNEGRVVRLTSRATVLMTLDGNHLRIPNAIVFKSIILNYTRNSERRFTFDLGVDADDDPVEGMAVGLAAVNALKFVLDTPKATAIIQDVGDSNILLRFFGWVDQAETDFLKGRSCAINAAAHALTSAGFALPEPIYRLRFDESAPLPLKSVDSAAVKKRSHDKPAPVALDSDENTSPDTHVEQLVTEERAETNKEDLLDSNRPIE